MTNAYHLAIDIGASSGRHILGRIEDGRIRLEEIHRFDNEAMNRDGTLQWDVDRLFAEIVAGLRKAGETGRRPASVGIDTWGVDFVLLDGDGKRLGPAVAYRDERTAGMEEAVAAIVSREESYARTGIQPFVFNTVFQLFAVKERRPEYLEQAESLLMLPGYLHYLLTGVKRNEYTHATTSQLVSAASGDWDRELIARLGLPEWIFLPIVPPGTALGSLTPEVRERVGYDLEVILPPTHDTASAVLAMPESGNDAVFLSSGTWSLMGVERDAPDCRGICLERGFTNEGGYGGRYRFLKTIMGLWIIQSLRKELAPHLGFADLAGVAEKGLGFETIVDVNHPSLLAPKSMASAMRALCADAGRAPGDDAELFACAYASLAKSYAESVADIERLSGRRCDRVCVMGGGSRDGLLNRLTARHVGKEVFAGPTEATAIGNILSQMIHAGELPGVPEARRAVRESFDIKRIEI